MEKGELGAITRWGKVPAWWLLHPDIDADRFCVLAAMATYADEHGFCEPSQATLARHLGRSRPWVNRVVAELSRFGLIEKTARSRRNGGTTSCLYRLAQEPVASQHPHPPVQRLTPRRPAGDAPRHGGDTSHAIPEQTQDSPLAARDGVPALVPQGWQPSTAALAAAEQAFPGTDAASHAAMFVARCRAKGYRYRPDALDDAWLSWFIEDSRREARRAGRTTGSPHTASVPRSPSHFRGEARGEARLAAWAAAAAAPLVNSTSPWS